MLSIVAFLLFVHLVACLHFGLTEREGFSACSDGWMPFEDLDVRQLKLDSGDMFVYLDPRNRTYSTNRLGGTPTTQKETLELRVLKYLGIEEVVFDPDASSTSTWKVWMFARMPAQSFKVIYVMNFWRVAPARGEFGRRSRAPRALLLPGPLLPVAPRVVPIRQQGYEAQAHQEALRAVQALRARHCGHPAALRRQLDAAELR